MARQPKYKGGNGAPPEEAPDAGAVVQPPVVPPRPAVAPDLDDDDLDVDPAANQKRLRSRLAVALAGMVIVIGGYGVHRISAINKLDSSTDNQAVEPAPPPPVAPPPPMRTAPSAEKAELAAWSKGPVNQSSNPRSRLDTQRADISITVTCLPSGYESGSAFFSWRNELNQPSIPDSNANPLTITGYGEIPHPNTLCLEHTGEASQYTRYFAAQ